MTIQLHDRRAFAAIPRGLLGFLVLVCIEAVACSKKTNETHYLQTGSGAAGNGSGQAGEGASAAGTTDTAAPSCSTASECLEDDETTPVCLLNHCNVDPPGPCEDGSCPPGKACATRLQEHCDGCSRSSGCVQPSVCELINGVPCAVTPNPDRPVSDASDAATGSRPSNGSTTSQSGGDGGH